MTFRVRLPVRPERTRRGSPGTPPRPLEPAPEVLAALSPMERRAFLLVHRMNRGRTKRVWTWCQRAIGARLIELVTSNLIDVYGLEHVEAVSPERPVLLVANHRSFFDMYAVSSVLFRRTGLPRAVYFPVRGRYFYQTRTGLLLNFLIAWWSMYPPFFATAPKRAFDQYALRLLTALCREGAGHVIGFHPEGTRNKNDDPYSYLRPQPGVGKLIKDATPQVIPVFVAGLGNDVAQQVMANFRGGEPIRIRFGPMIDFSELLARPDRGRTYVEIAELAMAKIAELGEEDREMRARG